MEFSSAVKSRPLYHRLEADVLGRRHLLILQAPDAAALRDLQARFAAVWHALTLWHCGGTPGAAAASVRAFDAPAPMLDALAAQLAAAQMGQRVYAAGSEPFLWSIARACARFDLHPPALQLEHRGSACRRVYCVHCKTLFEDVTSNPADCPGCGLTLSVRDHFSRRLGAFMGVKADAQCPGELAPPQAVFL